MIALLFVLQTLEVFCCLICHIWRAWPPSWFSSSSACLLLAWLHPFFLPAKARTCCWKFNFDVWHNRSCRLGYTLSLLRPFPTSRKAPQLCFNFCLSDSPPFSFCYRAVYFVLGAPSPPPPTIPRPCPSLVCTLAHILPCLFPFFLG